MAFPIPRIQYLNVDTTGDVVSASGVITGLPTTDGIVAGMFIRGTGIPTGALVGSVTDTSVTLASAVVATASNTGVSLSVGKEILFEFPPMEDTGGKLQTNATISESLSGLRQVSVNSVAEIRKFQFNYASPSIYTLLQTFLSTHALLGNSFRYYEDQLLTPYNTYELNTLASEPQKVSGQGPTTYRWNFPLDFRRVL